MEDIVTQQQRQIRQLQRDVERLKTIECGGGGGSGPTASIALAQMRRTTNQTLGGLSATVEFDVVDRVTLGVIELIDGSSPGWYQGFRIVQEGFYAFGGGVYWTSDAGVGNYRALTISLLPWAPVTQISFTDNREWQYWLQFQDRIQLVQSQFYLFAQDELYMGIAAANVAAPPATVRGDDGAVWQGSFFNIVQLTGAIGSAPGPQPPRGNYMGLLSPITYPL